MRSLRFRKFKYLTPPPTPGEHRCWPQNAALSRGKACTQPLPWHQLPLSLTFPVCDGNSHPCGALVRIQRGHVCTMPASVQASANNSQRGMFCHCFIIWGNKNTYFGGFFFSHLAACTYVQCLKTVLLTLQCAEESPGDLNKTHLLGSLDLRSGPRLCISNQLPGTPLLLVHGPHFEEQGHRAAFLAPSQEELSSGDGCSQRPFKAAMSPAMSVTRTCLRGR